MPFNTLIRTPSSHLVYGPSQSGKTTLAGEICAMRDVLFDKPATKVLWFYSDSSSIPKHLVEKGIIHETHQGVENYDSLRTLIFRHREAGDTVLCVFDDCLAYMKNAIGRAAMELCHRTESTFLFLVQQIFISNDEFKAMTLNCQHLWLMRNLRNKSFIWNLSKQVAPYQSSFLTRAFLSATNTKPYSHLYVNCSQHSSPVTFTMAQFLPSSKKPIITMMPE